MKTKVYLLSLIIGAVALLVASAVSPDADRPSGIEATNWIKISDSLGIATNSSSTDKLIGKFYAKRGKQWVELSIENSPRVVE